MRCGFFALWGLRLELSGNPGRWRDHGYSKRAVSVPGPYFSYNTLYVEFFGPRGSNQSSYCCHGPFLFRLGIVGRRCVSPFSRPAHHPKRTSTVFSFLVLVLTDVDNNFVANVGFE